MTSPNPIKGITLVLIAMVILPFIDVIAKFLGLQGIPVIQMVWARFFFGALFTLPLAIRATNYQTAMTPVNPTLNSIRAFCLIIGTAFFFFALKTLPIADVLAIYFVQPILITALSPLVLKERVDAQRWLMVLIGFLGVLIIIRPGFQQVGIGVVFALLAGFSSACYILVTRFLTGRAHSMVTTFQSSAIGTIPLTLAIPLFWTAPSIDQWLLLVLLGAIAITGHALITRAYDYAEASLLSPFNYTEMIMAVVCGWWFFGDLPDFWTYVGVGILMSCTFFISMRERKASSLASNPL